MEKKRVSVKIYGQVQGVSYRYYVQKKALKLKITGWAKNEPDGTVIVEAEGMDKALNKLIAWCQKGPSLARIEKVDIEWKDYCGDLEAFDIRY